MAAIYNLEVGGPVTLPLPDGCARLRVCGVWRDYARQFGAAVIQPALWQQHGGDARVNDLALWLKPGTQASAR